MKTQENKRKLPGRLQGVAPSWQFRRRVGPRLPLRGKVALRREEVLDKGVGPRVSTVPLNARDALVQLLGS